MIVQTTNDALVLIRQPDHAALAARIMAAWMGDGLPENPRRDEILTATRAHDDGWIVEDAAPRVDAAGKPLDFITVDVAAKQGVWPRAIESMPADRPYAAALVAQHALTAYASHRDNPEWQAFFTGMGERRQRLLAACGPASAQAIEHDYRFLRMGDILSLIFCGGWQQPYDYAGRRLERHGARLTVSPDPFAGRTVDLTLEARRVPLGPYPSDAALREACAAAPLERLAGTISGRA